MDVSSAVAALSLQNNQQTSLMMLKQTLDDQKAVEQVLSSVTSQATPPPGCGTQVDILA